MAWQAGYLLGSAAVEPPLMARCATSAFRERALRAHAGVGSSPCISLSVDRAPPAAAVSLNRAGLSGCPQRAPRRLAAMAGRILVAVKRVVDYNARVRVKPDKVGGGGGGGGAACPALAGCALTLHPPVLSSADGSGPQQCEDVHEPLLRGALPCNQGQPAACAHVFRPVAFCPAVHACRGCWATIWTPWLL